MVENLGVLEKTLWFESHRGEVSAQSSLVVAKSLTEKVQVIMGTNLDATTKRIQRPRFNNQNAKDSTTGYPVILEFPKIVLFEIPSSFKPHLIFFLLVFH